MAGATVAGRPARLPRPLHPGAWWLWALSLAVAASATTNPFLLGLLLVVVVLVVVERRSDAPHARGIAVYLGIAATIIVIRVLFRVLLGGPPGPDDTVLFTLPELGLPRAVAGIRVGGPVVLEAVLAAAYDGLRLATLLVCVGAANLLTDARRLLRLLPGALHELGVSMTVALSVAPQLIASGVRVRRARRLRGHPASGIGGVRSLLLPVLEDALDRSLLLAASMDSRGYGRTAAVPRGRRLLTGLLVIGGLIALTIGAYGLLDVSPAGGGAITALSAGLGLGAVGLWLGGRHVQRTNYRPDPWRLAEWGVVACGIATPVAIFVVRDTDPLSVVPPMTAALPEVPLLAVAGILVALTAAVIAPPVRRHGGVTARSSTPADQDEVSADTAPASQDLPGAVR